MYHHLFLFAFCVIVNAQDSLRCWNLRGDSLEERDCPSSPTNGAPFCTYYEFQGEPLVACSNKETCDKLRDLNYPNFICCNTTLCNYPSGFPTDDDTTPTPEPDPSDTGSDGILQCYDYNDDVSENKTVVDCPDLQNSKARCAVYTRVYDIPEDDLATTVIGQCSHELQCSDMSKQSWITDLKCCNDDLCNDTSGGGLPGWAIAIIVVVIIVVVLLLLLGLYFVVGSKKAERV